MWQSLITFTIIALALPGAVGECKYNKKTGKPNDGQCQNKSVKDCKPEDGCIWISAFKEQPEPNTQQNAQQTHQTNTNSQHQSGHAHHGSQGGGISYRFGHHSRNQNKWRGNRMAQKRSALDMVGYNHGVQKAKQMGSQQMQATSPVMAMAFTINDGVNRCEYPSGQPGTTGGVIMVQCEFDKILGPIPRKGEFGIRVLKEGTTLTRAERASILKDKEGKDIPTSAYDNFKDKKYLDKKHGLWFVSNPDALRAREVQSDPLKTEYEVTKSILVFWIPNLSRHNQIGGIDHSKGENYVTGSNAKYFTDISNWNKELQNMRDQMEENSESAWNRILQTYQPPWQNPNNKAVINIASNIPFIDILNNNLKIGGYAGCNECEVYLTTEVFKYLKAKGAEKRAGASNGKGYPEPKVHDNPFKAYVSPYGMSYAMERYDQSDESIVTENGYQFDYSFPEHPHVQERGTLSDRYYHDYGTYNYYTPDYVLLFAMGMMIFIGCCCLIIIISIIGGFISGKFYEMRKNQHSPSDRPKYEMVNEKEDQI